MKGDVYRWIYSPMARAIESAFHEILTHDTAQLTANDWALSDTELLDRLPRLKQLSSVALDFRLEATADPTIRKFAINRAVKLKRWRDLYARYYDSKARPPSTQWQRGSSHAETIFAGAN